MKPAHTPIQCLRDEGSGRPFVILFESEMYRMLSERLYDALSKRTRTLLVKSDELRSTNWQALTQELKQLIESSGIRQASFIGFSSASSLVLNLSLLELRMVRTVVLVDAATRPHPSPFTRIVDKIERILPLGLPLRMGLNDFDAKPFLQRIRCPALIITTKRATSSLVREAESMVQYLPTAWHVTLSEDELEDLESRVLNFQEVPAKCPQKNL